MVHISVELERLLQLRLGLCGAHLEGLAALEGLGELDDSLRDLLVRLAHRVPMPLEQGAAEQGLAAQKDATGFQLATNCHSTGWMCI